MRASIFGRARFLLVAVMLLFAAVPPPPAWCQGTTPTFGKPNYKPTPNMLVGQMLNIKNAYANKVMIDTPATGTTTLYLYTATGGTPVTSADTFVPYPIYGDGKLAFFVTGLKLSGTPAGTITLEESADGVNYFPSRASSIADAVDTVVSQTAGLYYSWDRPDKTAIYYRLKIALTGTEQSIWQGWYDFMPKSWISLSHM